MNGQGKRHSSGMPGGHRAHPSSAQYVIAMLSKTWRKQHGLAQAKLYCSYIKEWGRKL